MKWTANGLLPPGVCNDLVEATGGQRQPSVRAAFIEENHRAKLFSDGIHVTFMHKVAWVMGA